MNLHVIQHVPFETPAMIIDWANNNKHTVSYTRIFEIASFPEIDAVDMLLIMGGPMSVYDERKYEWMKAEKGFIKTFIQSDKPVLGICLGSQLLAEALGAKVYSHKTKEIGFFPILKTTRAERDELFADMPDEWNVFHWHGDTFDIPAGAELMAKTDACRNQAFRKNNCVGIQFHPEADQKLIEQMVQHCKEELVKAEFIQTEQEILSNVQSTEGNREWLYNFLDKLSTVNKYEVLEPGQLSSH
jgi:GMP synthase-like glutamine amidotransferase